MSADLEGTNETQYNTSQVSRFNTLSNVIPSFISTPDLLTLQGKDKQLLQPTIGDQDYLFELHERAAWYPNKILIILQYPRSGRCLCE